MRLIVLMGLALTAIAVAATVAVSQPTATTDPADAEIGSAALIAEIIATERAVSLAASDEALVRGVSEAAVSNAASDEALVRGTARIVPPSDSLADARDRATAGTATPTAPLPDSIADANDRANAAAAIAQSEAIAEAVRQGVC